MERSGLTGGSAAYVVIEPPPGEETQVDYGTGPMVRDSACECYQRTRLFVLTPGYSRTSVRQLTFHSTTRIWVELHERTFCRLGGVTRVIVLDNLGEAVITLDIYAPSLNPLYRDMLAHYGVVKINLSPVFELATAAFIGRGEDALCLGPMCRDAG
jgi:transposase